MPDCCTRVGFWGSSNVMVSFDTGPQPTTVAIVTKFLHVATKVQCL